MAPIKTPRPKGPPLPPTSLPAKRSLTQPLTGPPAVASRVCKTGTTNTAPTAIISTAAICRKTPSSSPMAKPNSATNKPMATNESVRPKARNTGPERPFEAAAPSTIGKTGSTQGDITVNVPATNAKNKVASIRALRTNPVRFQPRSAELNDHRNA